MIRIRVILLSVMLAMPAAASAALVDALAVTAGVNTRASSNVQLTRIALQKYWHRRWFNQGRWYLTGYWELGFGYWDDHTHRQGPTHLGEIDFRPVFRLERKVTSVNAPQFYVEAGVGPAVLSRTRLERLRFSIKFQFGSHIGCGVLFGKNHRYDIAYRFMHYSNADIRRPNYGMSFNVLQFAIRL